ncbi:sensor histidine kinase [Streptacidiphilus sp. MAP5-3]|uniref:sensor histidine kinase n=1 Tax=unclassified Streptacidiphilus TaxID=2643834 RepID=UPI0035187FDC
MTLRGRLALLTASAVALAVAIAALACWFLVQGQLYGQVDDNLTNAGGIGRDLVCAGSAPEAVSKASAAATPGYAAPSGSKTQYRWDSELVLPDEPTNSVCVQPGSSVGITVAHSYLAVPVGETQIIDGTYTDGSRARVRVVSSATNTGEPYILLTAYPLDQVTHELGKLLVVLLAIAVSGIVAAGAIGLLVARAALKPVDKLTAAVEHIARTEEVGTTIDVAGDDEIARLSESFNSMSTALAASRERQSQLIADAGHELRTPLTSLRTNVDLLVRSEDAGRPLPPDTHTRLLRNMKAQMGELSTLIGDLLELSRPTRPKGSKPLEVIALHDIVARALDRARLRGPGLEFTVQVEPWYVRADAHALERAVINLLDNAVKFSPAGGTIDVALKFGTLTVRDHGPGIPEDDLAHVFERFWRSPAARQMPGSGLGLAIVSQTVHDHGGEVSLSNAHPGTLATLQLPGAPTPPPELPTEV